MTSPLYDSAPVGRLRLRRVLRLRRGCDAVVEDPVLEVLVLVLELVLLVVLVLVVVLVVVVVVVAAAAARSRDESRRFFSGVFCWLGVGEGEEGVLGRGVVLVVSWSSCSDMPASSCTRKRITHHVSIIVIISVPSSWSSQVDNYHH